MTPTESFPSWPSFEADERLAVQSVLESGRVNAWTGEECRTFERHLALASGTRHAVVMANGSVTLDAILAALGIGAGDEVIVTPRSFIASASCVALRGARPVFADVDRSSQNLTAATVAPKIAARTRAIIAVHLAGWPSEMTSLLELADSHGLTLIEDCAQAHGARYRDRPVGSIGHVASFSFCQDKIITTGGEGGAVVTDDDALWQKIWSYKDHGKSHDKVFNQAHPPGFRWLHDGIGTNLRMTEMQAAIGIRQYGKLERWSETRRRNAAVLNDAFRDVPALRTTEPPAHMTHAYYKYYVFVRQERLKPDWSRDRIMNEVNQLGIPCLAGICPEIYREKAFQDLSGSGGDHLPVAAELGQHSLMFPVHPTLTAKHMTRMASALIDVMADARR